MRVEASTDFTAVADCPKCGNIAVHWLAEPSRFPETGEEISRVLEFHGAMMVFSGRAELLIDPDDCVVARVCRECEHRWPMK